MKMLIFISKDSQFFKTIFKEFRTIVSVAILQKIRMIFISTMILFPCLVKAESIKPVEVDPVLMNSSFVFEIFPFPDLSLSGEQSNIQGIKKLVFPETFYATGVYNGTEFSRLSNDSLASFSPDCKGMVETLSNPMPNDCDYGKRDYAIEPLLSKAQRVDEGKEQLFWLFMFFITTAGSIVSSVIVNYRANNYY